MCSALQNGTAQDLLFSGYVNLFFLNRFLLLNSVRFGLSFYFARSVTKQPKIPFSYERLFYRGSENSYRAVLVYDTV
jgi:hypothetical protein